METKKLKFQTVAAGNQGTVDATIVEGENKENNAAKTAGMAAAGIAAGAAAGYAGYEVYQQFAGTVEAEPMTADEALDAVAGLTADNTVTERWSRHSRNLSWQPNRWLRHSQQPQRSTRRQRKRR